MLCQRQLQCDKENQRNPREIPVLSHTQTARMPKKGGDDAEMKTCDARTETESAQRRKREHSSKEQHGHDARNRNSRTWKRQHQAELLKSRQIAARGCTRRLHRMRSPIPCNQTFDSMSRARKIMQLSSCQVALAAHECAQEQPGRCRPSGHSLSHGSALLSSAHQHS